jgi:hypothetical protein
MNNIEDDAIAGWTAASPPEVQPLVLRSDRGSYHYKSYCTTSRLVS